MSRVEKSVIKPKTPYPKNSKHCSSKKKRLVKKMKGGFSANHVFSASQLPDNTYYKLNEYEPDLLRGPELVASRLLLPQIGGKKPKKCTQKGGVVSRRRCSRGTRKKCKNGKLHMVKSGSKKVRKTKRRKMKGGSLIGTDLLTGSNTSDTNNVLAFGTTGGTQYMLNTLINNSN